MVRAQDGGGDRVGPMYRFRQGSTRPRGCLIARLLLYRQENNEPSTLRVVGERIRASVDGTVTRDSKAEAAAG